MNKKLLKKIFSSMAILGLSGSGASASATHGLLSGLNANSGTKGQKLLKNFLDQDNPSENEVKENQTEKNEHSELDDYDILKLALNPLMWDYKVGNIKTNIPNTTEVKYEDNRSYNNEYEYENNIKNILNKELTVDYQQKKANEALEEWILMGIAFKGDKFDVSAKLAEFGFKDLLKLKRNARYYLNYINNFFEKDMWDELVLDGVKIRKNDLASREIQYYLKLFVFYDHFDFVDSSIDRFKNAYGLMNDDHMFQIIKNDVNNYWESNNIILEEQPKEFYVWAWINIVFSEANLKWRSSDIVLHREDPYNPLNQIKSSNNEISEEKSNQNGITTNRTLFVEIH